MELLIVTPIFLSHAFASIPFWRRLTRLEIPSVADFATLSVILYFDVGLALEVLGVRYESSFFESFYKSINNLLLLEILILIVTPWLFHLGSVIANPKTELQIQEPVNYIRPSRRNIFYLVAILICIPLAVLGYIQITGAKPIWAVRREIGEAWGSSIIILYLPLHILAYYVRQRDSRTKSGYIFTLFLIIVSILSTIQIGQRTTVLLPFLILLLFTLRVNLWRFSMVAIVGVIIASALLPLFKWQYGTRIDITSSELLINTIQNDVSRTAILSTALKLSDSLGTRIMPYPLSGYVYSALFFVPRQVAPFKGDSTAKYFTSYIAGTTVEETSWGFGLGVIEEISLNAGTLFIIPGLIFYGFVMGRLDLFSKKNPSSVVPSRLGALWLCGYHLPAILLLFGSMMLTCRLLSLVFEIKGNAICEYPSASRSITVKAP